jgi:ABC-type amino acid transport substrate-binding protein
MSTLEPAARTYPTKREDGFADIGWAAMVPKGNADRIAYLNDFLREAKASGLVQQTIDRYGLKGIKVAPSNK